MGESSAHPVSAGAQLADEGVFLRKASGLIKTASATDVFFFNLGLVSIGIAVALTQLYGAAFYPGGSLWGGRALATVIMVPIAITFSLLTMTYPRSGGLYVYLSRVFGPFVGYTFSFAESAILLSYGALAATYVTTMGVAPMFATLGAVTSNSTLSQWGTDLTGHGGEFIIGTSVIVLGGILLISGMAKYFAVQRVLLAVAVLGTILTLILLVAYSRGSLITHFNSLMRGQVGGNAYQKEITHAKAAGWRNPGFDFGQTVKLLVWPLLALLGSIQSIGIGGEIKNVNRNQWVGMLGALLGSGLLLVVIAVLSVRAFGYDFMGAVAYNTLNADPKFTPAITPFFTFLASLLVYSPVLVLVITATFAIWPFFWVPLELAYVDRSLLVWALDRMAPDRVGYVDERLHTPVVAIVIVTAVAEIFLALFVFTPWFGTLSLIEGLSLIWGTAMVAAALLPYLKPDVWSKSPASNYRLFGLPLITVIGTVAAVAFAFVIYLLWTDPIAAGHTTPSVLWQIGIFVGGAVLYAITRYFRQRQGLNVSFAFKDIPVE